MPKTSKETCFDSLKQRILTLDLAPGTDLEEAALADHYGLSRTPLREVLQRLAGSGYVRIASNKGAKVASMDIATMRTFFQTAPMIYANIARLAAENRRAVEVDALKDIQRAFAEAVRAADTQASALQNHAFHAQIGQMARNPYLLAGLDRLLIDHTRLSDTFYRPTEPQDRRLIAKAVEQHDAMIAAIETQDTALAIDLTLQHWDLSRDRIERFVRPDPLPVELIHAV